MFWIKNHDALKAGMREPLTRVWTTARDHWRTATIWKRDNGKWHGIDHDVMNVLTEAARIDPYFVVHWLILVIVLLTIAVLV